MIPQTIVIDGYDGSIPEDTSTGPVWARAAADLDQAFPAGWNDRYEANDQEVRGQAVELFRYHLFMPSVVRHHNTAVPAAQQHAQATRMARGAVAAADSAYADLNKNTTINWLAAHHRFILAAVEARRTLTEVVDAAIALRDGEFGKEMVGITRTYYEQAVPVEQRITLPDVDAAQLELAEFDERTRERIDILRATVSGDYPQGFTPAPAGPRTELAQDDWADERPASVAVVAKERAW